MATEPALKRREMTVNADTACKRTDVAEGDEEPTTSARGATASDDASRSVCTVAQGLLHATVRTCVQCGQSFVPRRQRRDVKFCRPAHRARWHAERRTHALLELEEIVDRATALIRDLRHSSLGSRGSKPRASQKRA